MKEGASDFIGLLRRLKSSNKTESDKAWNTIHSVLGRAVKMFIVKRVKKYDDIEDIYNESWERFLNEIKAKLLIRIEVSHVQFENYMKANEGNTKRIPQDIIDSLNSLAGSDFDDSYKFLEACKQKIGIEQATKHRNKLVKLAGTLHFETYAELRSFLFGIAHNRLKESYGEIINTSYEDALEYNMDDDEIVNPNDKSFSHYMDQLLIEEKSTPFIDCFKKILSSFEEVLRTIILRHYGLNVPYKDIAEDLNLEKNTEKYNANNCRQKSARAMESLKRKTEENCNNL